MTIGTLFSEAQLEELERVFELKRRPKAEVAPVRDGLVRKHDMVWWRSEEGPELVSAEEHWGNIQQHPSLYSIGCPRVRYVYDEPEGAK